MENLLNSLLDPQRILRRIQIFDDLLFYQRVFPSRLGWNWNHPVFQTAAEYDETYCSNKQDNKKCNNGSQSDVKLFLQVSCVRRNDIFDCKALGNESFRFTLQIFIVKFIFAYAVIVL